MPWLAAVLPGLLAGLLRAAPEVAPPRNPPPGVVATRVDGIHNVFHLGTNVYSGSSPTTSEAFAALARLGVKTIVSVDGARPEVELARQHGLRYVHLPHGYDGIKPATQQQLVRVGRELPGPIYIHCHHGLHRGPAAAALVCMGTAGWSREQATGFLTAAGTSTNYSGLYQVVREFTPPDAAPRNAPGTGFPEVASTTGMVDAMVAIDARWDHLKAVRVAGYKAPPGQPDIDPAHEALMLREHYREVARLPEAARQPADFRERLNAAEAGAHEAERLLRDFARNPDPAARAGLDKAFQSLGQRCVDCHRQHRDVPGGIGGRP